MILRFKSLGNKVSHLPLLKIDKVSYDEIDFLMTEILKSFQNNLLMV